MPRFLKTTGDRLHDQELDSMLSRLAALERSTSSSPSSASSVSPVPSSSVLVDSGSTAVSFSRALPVTVLPLSTDGNAGYWYLLEAASQYDAQVDSEPSLQQYWSCSDLVGSTIAMNAVLGGIASTAVSNIVFGSSVIMADALSVAKVNTTAGYIKFASMPAALNAGDFTLEFAAQLTGSGSDQSILGDFTSTSALRVVLTSTNHLAIYLGGSLRLTSAGTWTGGAFAGVVITYTYTSGANVLTLYVNGVYDNAVSVTAAAWSRPALADVFCIGDVLGTSSALVGPIGKVAVYGALLSLSRVQSHYTASQANSDTLWMACQIPFGSYVMQQVLLP